ncbi:lactosylceramide 4-alpha-galactosyltransferase [Salvia divinorum]|uniref:Lactosylceramide 4-alpha-galactosyltransferase n=1 Tax=Salvia divinorum TaxID=28513 RepID=A0ABD1HUM1_SALDI
MDNIPTIMSQLLLIWQRGKISFCAFLSLLFLCPLAYNGAAIFCISFSFPGKTPPEPASFLPEYVPPLPSIEKETSGANLTTVLPLLHSNQNMVVSMKRTTLHRPNRKRFDDEVAKILLSEAVKKRFELKVIKFFKRNSCKFRFFMTWISSVESFGDRELLCVESVFKTHPNGCLIIASNSLDSLQGRLILKPFSDMGFKVAAITPDFSYLLRNTAAAAWYNRLKRGNVNPGEISLGQNLSNLLRIGLLYRFGGIYLDTDVLVLKSFGELRNAIGAQSSDLATGNWSRLNNAVMVFDKGHPVVLEFMEEFAHTFDGNRWGHNGPYLVSRVVARLSGRPRFDLTVLPPVAFYPVRWNRIGGLFEGAKGLSHSKWMVAKLRQIRSQSFAVHLWNKQSRQFKVEEGSIIQHLMFSSRVVKNSSVFE